MKINEVEALVNITKKNIRFYEEMGLINPARNEQNRYREYTDEDVEMLRKVKLLRQLSIPRANKAARACSTVLTRASPLVSTVPRVVSVTFSAMASMMGSPGRSIRCILYP